MICVSVSDPNATIYYPHKVAAGGSAVSAQGLETALGDRLQLLSYPGAMPAPGAGHRLWPQAVGSREVSQLSVRDYRSPSESSEFAEPPDHLGSDTTTAIQISSPPSSNVHHGLRLLSLQERLAMSRPNRPRGDHWASTSTAQTVTSRRTDDGENGRVPPRHPDSGDLITGPSPVRDSSSPPARSPSPPAESRSRGLRPARQSEERQSDSGTASGDECDPTDPSDLSTHRRRLSDCPEASGCCPTRGEVSGCFPRRGEAPEVDSATSASPAERIKPYPQQHHTNSAPEEPTALADSPDRLAPPEATSATARGPAPRIAGSLGAEPDDPKDPSLAALGITAELCSRDLWLEFHEHGTEMIITKMGR